MQMKFLFSLPMVALAACSTPQERCIMTASEELRTVERLMAETEENLARGYRLEQELRPGFELRFCHHPNGYFHWCNHHTTRVSEVEVAIDPQAEQRKLDALSARRDALVQDYGNDLASCEARFPEG